MTHCVPYQAVASCPGDDRGPIRLSIVSSTEATGLQGAGDVYCHQGALDVVETGVSQRLPWLPRQLKAWIPVLSTLAPHWAQSCGRQRAEPRHTPTAIHIMLLSIRMPKADTSGTLSHAPDSFCWEANRRALAMGFALVMRLAARALATGLSQAF